MAQQEQSRATGFTVTYTSKTGEKVTELPCVVTTADGLQRLLVIGGSSAGETAMVLAMTDVAAPEVELWDAARRVVRSWSNQNDEASKKKKKTKTPL